MRPAPCRVGGRRRTLAVVATTAGVATALAAPPAVVALAVRELVAGGGLAALRESLGGEAMSAAGRDGAVLLGAAVVVLLAWAPVALAVAAELQSHGGAPRRSRLVPAAVRRVVGRHVERSLLGAGTLRSWTRTRVDGSLRQLRLPAPSGMPATASGEPVAATAAAVPASRRSERLRRGVRLARKPAPPRHASARPGRGAAEAPAGHRPRPSYAGADAASARPPGVDAGADPTEPASSYVVARGDTWWGLAERFLGDGRRFAELKERNAGRPQPDGAVVRRDAPLRAGWTIEVPAEGERVGRSRP